MSKRYLSLFMFKESATILKYNGNIRNLIYGGKESIFHKNNKT